MLVDISGSYNFISQCLVKKLGWKLHTQAPLEGRLANGDRVALLGAVCGLVHYSKWQAHIYFFVLDLIFDLVLGTPWLTAANPWMDWAQRTMMVQVKGRWIGLTMLAHEHLCAAMAKVFG